MPLQYGTRSRDGAPVLWWETLHLARIGLAPSVVPTVARGAAMLGAVREAWLVRDAARARLSLDSIVILASNRNKTQ